MDWSRWSESGTFEKMGVGKMKATPRTYSYLACPLCGDAKAMVVLRERLVSLRPRVVRDHLLTCAAVAEEDRSHFGRKTAQQQRRYDQPRKKSKAERRAAKEEKEAEAEAHKSVMAKAKGEEAAA